MLTISDQKDLLNLALFRIFKTIKNFDDSLFFIEVFCTCIVILLLKVVVYILECNKLLLIIENNINKT